jgi:hypothetical protein
MGAIGFTSIWTDQDIAQIQLLFGCLFKNEETGVLTHILLETPQLVIGLSFPLFPYPLTQVLEFLHISGFSMSVNFEHQFMPLFIPKEPRDGIYNAQMMSPLWIPV